MCICTLMCIRINVYISIFTYYFQAHNSHPVLYVLAFRRPRLPPLLISPLLPSPSLLLSSHLFILFLPSSVLSSFLSFNFFSSLLHSAHLISYILQDGIGSRDQWTFSYCEMHIRSDLVWYSLICCPSMLSHWSAYILYNELRPALYSTVLSA